MRPWRKCWACGMFTVRRHLCELCLGLLSLAALALACAGAALVVGPL